MQPSERASLIAQVYDALKRRSGDSSESYEALLPYARVGVSVANEQVNSVTITTHYFDPAFSRNSRDEGFQGLRQMYYGSEDGLDEVILEGVLMTQDGDVQAPQSLRRFRDSEDGRGITHQDEHMFDTLLLYVSKHL